MVILSILSLALDSAMGLPLLLIWVAFGLMTQIDRAFKQEGLSRRFWFLFGGEFVFAPIARSLLG